MRTEKSREVFSDVSIKHVGQSKELHIALYDKLPRLAHDVTDVTPQ